ncbi:LacI family DNA-binding transcriptional regulator [Nakamurella aerolata]|uniref:LacI family DNA-binding transcriptional regulator n=1 Tax=Nakamurella aerolata TaxID=1656892 RepID=A0A849AD78_9ACTN|nr:LacI family DNA-binding transcriptional regulator [Nakamurella aerolata]NNG37536.1 LacI family DNA-binding transcriptional regulator [Nakamurella aerolata]
MAGRGRLRRVTLRDIADRVGVTPTAVSMALADNPRISANTRQTIKATAHDLGYVPSSAARALRNQRAGAIALIVPTTATHVFGHSYFMHVLEGTSLVANERDVQLLVSTNRDTEHGLAAYERVMRSRSADGAILTSAAIDDPMIEPLIASGLPVVMIGSFPYLPSAVTVGVDDRAASRAMTEHLITAHNRTSLLHISGTLDHQTGVDRRDGFLDAVRAHHLEGDARIVEGDLSEESGRRAIADLGEQIREIDGLVAANDDMAFGALTALRSIGLEVPADLSIAGCDDFGLARVTTPSLTTIRVPAKELAQVATTRLFEIMDGKDGWHRHVLEVELVLRQSCGCQPLDDTDDAASVLEI